MTTELPTIAGMAQAQQDANEAEFRRLRDLSLEERGRMLQAACQADAPFVEKLVATGPGDDAATAARKRLQAVLDQLAPDKGKTAPPDVPKAKRKGAKARKQRPQA